MKKATTSKSRADKSVGASSSSAATSASFLALADGRVFPGVSVGAPVDSVGEAVFNTGMMGYQEIISDPSYAGQFVTLSTAEVGNYGCNPDDMESRSLFLSGLIVQGMNPPSNFRATESLPDCLKRFSKPCLAGVDTRDLVTHLRDHGTQRAYLHVDGKPMSEKDAIAKAKAWEGLDGQDYATKVSDPKEKIWSAKGKFNVVVYDFGVKFNILRQLAEAGMKVTVVPAWTSAKDVLARKPDGVFLSNGPADPAAVKGAIENAKYLIGKVPLMGICLGHQILGIASGAECHRLKFGHHGCNHPVKNLIEGTIEITSQNHNFCLDAKSFPKSLELTHINLNDNSVEGIRSTKEPMFAVQYHPEAAPGPWDSRYLFKQFASLMEGNK